MTSSGRYRTASGNGNGSRTTRRASVPPQDARTSGVNEPFDAHRTTDPRMLAPESMLHLQRVVGNATLVRLIDERRKKRTQEAAHDSAAETVQRYMPMGQARPSVAEWARQFQRRSQNRGIYQLAEQSLVARDDIIEKSEEGLEKQQSAVQIVKGDAFTTGYSRVRLRVRASRVKSLRGGEDVQALGGAQARPAEENKSLQLEALREYIKINKGKIGEGQQVAARRETVSNMSKEVDKLANSGDTHLFLTIRDCHMTARLIMGDLGLGKPARRREHMEVSNPRGPSSIEPKIEDTNMFSTTANRGAIGVLKANFSTFSKVMTDAGFGPSEPSAHKGDVLAKLENINTGWDYTKAMELYRLIQADPHLRTLFNRTYSINEYAKVAIGQALVIVNDEREKKQADDGKFEGGRELWNYHWAGVILQDGRDYVTLEALADQNATTLTTQWMLKMYGMVDRNTSEEEQAGQSGQTFHGEQSANPHTGTRPITLGVGAH